MSLTIDKPLLVNGVDTGFLLGFHKVTEVHIIRHELRAVVVLNHYKDANACDANNCGFTNGTTFVWTGGQFPFPPEDMDEQDNNVYKIAENKIKADGIDHTGFNWSSATYTAD